MEINEDRLNKGDEMRPVRIALVAVVGLSLLSACVRRVHIRAAEPSPKPVTVTRIYTGSDGLTHIDETQLKLSAYTQGHGDAA
jgi:hypothetical protein